MISESIQVSVSILSADFARLADEIKKIEESGADMVHVDVMDGHFVPPITVGALIVRALRPLTRLTLDAHLMVEHPGSLIDDFLAAGADSLSIHAECYGELKAHSRPFGAFPKEIVSLDAERAGRDIDRIQQAGKKAFLVVNPGTDIRVLDPVLPDIDGVLVMSVNPGFSGQSFMPEVLSKVQYLRDHFGGAVAVDGGINDETGAQAVQAGATILATASYFFQSTDPGGSVRILKSGKGR